MAPGKKQQQVPLAQPPVVLITGCTEGGIGHQLCLYMADRGCRVFATARRAGAAPQLEARGIPVLLMDVRDQASCTKAVDDVIAAAGRIDILVNNAGIVTLGPTCEVPMDVVQKAYDTNVFGIVRMCQAVYRQMVAQGSGKIVNIGSLTGLQPVPLRGIYSSTKGAVTRLTDALRLELGPLGVQVLLVAPGFIQTNARDTAHSGARSGASAPPTGGVWGNWLEALARVMAARLDKAVPVDAYAAQLGSLILRRRLPRVWVGRTAGLEWLPRFMPQPLRDRVLSKALGINALLPEMRLAQGVLAAKLQEKGGAAAAVTAGAAAAAGKKDK